MQNIKEDQCSTRKVQYKMSDHCIAFFSVIVREQLRLEDNWLSSLHGRDGREWLRATERYIVVKGMDGFLSLSFRRHCQSAHQKTKEEN